MFAFGLGLELGLEQFFQHRSGITLGLTVRIRVRVGVRATVRVRVRLGLGLGSTVSPGWQELH